MAVRVSYDAKPFAVTFEGAMAPDAPTVRGTTNVMRGSPAIVERGDVPLALTQADVVVTREYRTASQLHSPLEPHASVAEWEGDRLTLWESTQGVFRVRDEVALGLGLPKSHVRVIKEHMGAASGPRTTRGRPARRRPLLPPHRAAGAACWSAARSNRTAGTVRHRGWW
jgi:xanthine dehydrogenase YagR molybdenum-binding subunit